MIRIAICDDEIMMTSKIEAMLIQLSESNGIELDIDVFFDGETLEKSIRQEQRFDLIYLDIEMKAVDGIEAAKNIRKMDRNVIIIYISNYESYLKELFEVEAFRFISKPINKAMFENYFLKAYERLCSYASYYEFQYKRELYKILLGDIIYFESKGRTINIVLADGKVEKFNGKLNDVEQELKSCKIGFLRIHQSYLISYYFIKSMTKTHVKLFNGSVLQISEERQKDIRKKYCKLLGGEISD
jgi:DNA-binding LytR/AlgR family response regulator